MDGPGSKGQSDGRGYSAAQILNFNNEVQKLKDETIDTKADLVLLAEQLRSPRAKTFVNQGIARRLEVVGRSASNIYEIYPPNKKELLTKDEGVDVAIQFHAFVINLYGIFDNIAWALMLEAGECLASMKIGLFKKECQPFIPEVFRSYLAQPQVREWFDKYGKLYRDSTAHRIAPYLPPKVFTPEEKAKWIDIDSRSIEQLRGAGEAMTLDRQRGRQMLESHEALEKEKNELGANSLFIALSLTGEDSASPVYLHPQILCDWGLANEISRQFIGAMRAITGGQHDAAQARQR
jgi:hypothetical protein